MMTIRVKALLTAFALGSTPPALHGQPAQAEITVGLAAVDRGTGAEALAVALQVPPGEIGAPLRAALVRALADEGELQRERYLRSTQGAQLEELEEPELILALVRAVAPMREPEAIRPLASALGNGLGAVRALAGFGSSAVRPVIEAISSPEASPYAVQEGLIALRFVVEGAGETVPAGAELAEIRQVAEYYLNSRDGPLAATGTTLRFAVDLATALDDPGLRRTIQAIATDPNEARSRGIVEPELIRKAQELARDRLNGVPAVPASGGGSSSAWGSARSRYGSARSRYGSAGGRAASEGA